MYLNFTVLLISIVVCLYALGIYETLKEIRERENRIYSSSSHIGIFFVGEKMKTRKVYEVETGLRQQGIDIVGMRCKVLAKDAEEAIAKTKKMPMWEDDEYIRGVKIITEID